jgi:hypothetical protein
VSSSTSSLTSPVAAAQSANQASVSLVSSLELPLVNPTQSVNGAATVSGSQPSDPIDISTFSLSSNLDLGSLAQPTFKIKN